MKLDFPILGLHQGLPAADQPLQTSPLINNCRPTDVTEDRIRGGQRPGLKKAYDTQIGGTHPVIAMVQIDTTYITPSA
jgi:hypothetical protein